MHRITISIIFIIIIIIDSYESYAISTVPPVPLTIRIQCPGEEQSSIIVVRNEKEIDHLSCTVLEKLYEKDPLFIQWYTESNRRALLDTDWGYHNYDKLTQKMQQFHNDYPHITQLFSIGKSIKQRELWVLKIFSNNSNNTTSLRLKPKVKFVGNMHGDEAVGREILIHLIDEILSSLQTSDRIVRLLNNIDLYILPSMNPDGFELGRRGNYNNIDLNRNFPDQFVTIYSQRQPETQAIIDWIKSTQFTLSANFHGGALVASYGWDGVPSGRITSGVYSAAPDDELLKYLAHLYSDNHLKMSFKNTNSEFGGSPDYGITNGAYWYALYGSMQDFNYIHAQCAEITFEVSEIKYPPAGTLQQFYKDNRESMLKYLEQGYQSVVGGYIYRKNDLVDVPLLDTPVTIHISGVNYNIKSSDGTYFRLIVPGNLYNITASADGYYSSTVCHVVIPDANTRESIVRIDFYLKQKKDDNGSLELTCDSYYDSDGIASGSSSSFETSYFLTSGNRLHNRPSMIIVTLLLVFGVLLFL
jgi:hypothetical protein